MPKQARVRHGKALGIETLAHRLMEAPDACKLLKRSAGTILNNKAWFHAMKITT